MYGSGAGMHGKAIRVLVTATELAAYLAVYIPVIIYRERVSGCIVCSICSTLSEFGEQVG